MHGKRLIYSEKETFFVHLKPFFNALMQKALVWFRLLFGLDMKHVGLYLAMFIQIGCLPMLVSNVSASDKTDVPPLYEEMECSDSETNFTFWSPKASQVTVQIYNEARNGKPVLSFDMQKMGEGFWLASANKDYRGKFYTFRVKYKGDWLEESPGIKALAVGVNGTRGAIIDLEETNPTGWEADTKPALRSFTDMSIYRLNIREFSMGKQSGIVNKGKYLALTEDGATNKEAFCTGLSHLIDLGVSHVLLMPVYDFYTDDESRPRDVLRYWTSLPLNFNVPEGSYSTRPFDPVSRIREFKQMVLSLHKSGLRVMMDVSYDHTAPLPQSIFARSVPGLFYRLNADGSFSNASGFGNEIASEQPLSREYILRSLLYWVKEYHIDGFCFGQSGVMDMGTVNSIRKALDAVDPSIFICGDGISSGTSVLSENERALVRNNIFMPGMAFFNEVTKQAIRGVETDSMDVGFLQGKTGGEEFIRFGIVGGIRHPQVDAAGAPGFRVNYARSPKEVIQQVSSEHGFTLFDQLNASSRRKECPEQLTRKIKLANGMVMTSQGIPFIQSGEEIMISRDGIPGTVETPDSICRLNWRNKTDYNDLYEFYHGMAELRLEHPAFRMDEAGMVQKYLRFLETTDKGVVAFLLENHPNGDAWKNILVIHNGNDRPVNVAVPSGRWKSVVLDGEVNPLGISFLTEGRADVPAVSTLVAYQP
jgi:pullulanase